MFCESIYADPRAIVAEITAVVQTARLFGRLVGGEEQAQGHVNSERAGSRPPAGGPA